jgi:hypothetical protein
VIGLNCPRLRGGFSPLVGALAPPERLRTQLSGAHPARPQGLKLQSAEPSALLLSFHRHAWPV